MSPADLLAKNRAWAEARTRGDPAVFRRLAEAQHPPFLWIGCSDSRVPADTVVGLEPGQMFVHRNIANLAGADDPSCLAVLQYAVEVLRVRHILVVGHYGCGGVAAALHGAGEGAVRHWLAPIRELAQSHGQELEALGSDRHRHDRLCELNVIHQVRNVAQNLIVAKAWAAGQAVAVHGWCYALKDGLITDLKVSVAGPTGTPDAPPGP